MAKKWLFWFCEGSVCVSGQNQMCRLCGCLKLFLKNAGRQKKIKKHWGGLSVGLLAVPFQYGLYVFGHLSKWFVFVLMFKFWSVYRLWNGRPTIGYNVFELPEVRFKASVNRILITKIECFYAFAMQNDCLSRSGIYCKCFDVCPHFW